MSEFWHGTGSAAVIVREPPGSRWSGSGRRYIPPRAHAASFTHTTRTWSRPWPMSAGRVTTCSLTCSDAVAQRAHPRGRVGRHHPHRPAAAGLLIDLCDLRAIQREQPRRHILTHVPVALW